MTPRIRTTFTTDYHTHAYLKQTKHCILRHKHLTLSRPNKQELLFMDGKDNVGPRFRIKEETISCNWVYIRSHCADRFSLHIVVYLVKFSYFVAFYWAVQFMFNKHSSFLNACMLSPGFECRADCTTPNINNSGGLWPFAEVDLNSSAAWHTPFSPAQQSLPPSPILSGLFGFCQ